MDVIFLFLSFFRQSKVQRYVGYVGNDLTRNMAENKSGNEQWTSLVFAGTGIKLKLVHEPGPRPF